MILSSDPKVNKPEDFQAWLIEHLAEYLNTLPENIKPDEPFESFGLSSKEMVMISGDLEEEFDVRLEPTVVWQYPTIFLLSRYLSGEENKDALLVDSEQSKWENEPIAVVGMSCRFPGSKGPDAYWDILINGIDAISETPKDRWNNDEYFDPDLKKPGTLNTRWGGYIEDVDYFDNEIFKISPREASRIDPQQRLLMEVTREAIENSGHNPIKLSGSQTGVFIGISTSDYSSFQLSNSTLIDAYAGTGNAHSIAANRLSYFFDLRGPSYAVDTACSSSLVSIHLAVQSLRNGECEMALAGGVNLLLTPELTIAFSHARLMAADGRCKTFDSRADGYVRGEGCGIVVLKRISDAVDDGDNILGLIRGSAINHDGRSNGLTAPNGLSQQAVIKTALSNAGISPDQISYIEAHGTGTPLGDPIEFNALKSVFNETRNPNKKLLIGSAKTNIGHLESAAGVAGFIKVLLAMQHASVPPHLHLKDINPQIDLTHTSISFPLNAEEWQPENSDSLYAGVSSFGFGGTNAHIIIESWRTLEGDNIGQSENIEAGEQQYQLLTLSARNESSLKQLSKKYYDFLDTSTGQKARISEICYSANLGREHYDARLAIIAKDKQIFQKNLQSFIKGEKTSGHIENREVRGKKVKIAFLFSGQGSQYVGMGRELYETAPTFRKILDECNSISEPLLEHSLFSVIFPKDEEAKFIHETAYTQPALFSLEYAIAQLLLEWGIKPDLLLGHSIGEYTAACFAGVFSLEDGLRLILERGRLMNSLPRNGSMAAVFANLEYVEDKIRKFPETIAIATVNGPTNIVISGKTVDLSRIIRSIEDEGVECRHIDVSHAFHSPLMDPILDAFQQKAKTIDYRPLRYPLASNLFGMIIPSGETLNQDYWVNHLRQPVLFASGMDALENEGIDTFIEIGPSPVLLGMGKRYLKKSELSWFPSLRKGKSDKRIILNLVGNLYTKGLDINWEKVHKPNHHQKIPLPTYPYDRKRFWFDIDPEYESIGKESGSDLMSDVGKWLHKLVWEQVDLKNQAKSDLNFDGPLIIFADNFGLADNVKKKIEGLSNKNIYIYPDNDFNKRSTTEYSINPTNKNDYQRLFNDLGKEKHFHIVHLWSLNSSFNDDNSLASLQSDINVGCVSTLYLVQTLEDLNLLKDQSIRVYFFTVGSHQVLSSPHPLMVSQAPLWSLTQSIALEYPELSIKLIDLDPSDPLDGFDDIWFSTISSDRENKIAYRTGLRYVHRLEPYQLSNLQKREFSYDSEGSYLITGGTGALGLSLARRLIDRGAKTLILASRTQFPDNASNIPEEIEESLQQKILTIRELTELGATIHTVSLDVADKYQMLEAFGNWSKKYPPLKGIVHLAGVVVPQIIHQLTAENLYSVMRPKVFGTWLLHELSAEMNLDFFVLFSSAASVLNPPLLGSYAAANAFLDAIAHYRHSQGRKALSINWGFWDGKGMAVQYKGAEARTLVPKGMKSIPTEKGLDTFENLVMEDQAQICVIPTDWREFSLHDPRIRYLPLISNMTGEIQTEPESNEKPSLSVIDGPTDEIKQDEKLFTLPRKKWGEYLTNYIKKSISTALMMDPGEITSDQNLLELGIDSLMVMDLTGNLERDFRITVYPREVFERPSIKDFAEYLEIELTKLYPKEKSEGERSAETPADIESSVDINFFGIQDGIAKYHRPQKIKSQICFILSSPRSGSTLLRVMLAGHPDLFCPPELHLLPFEQMKSRSQILGDSYLDEGLTRSIMAVLGIEAIQAERLVEEWSNKKLPIEDVYAYIQKEIDPKILVDKSPSYAINFEVLDRAEIMFDNPKYILITRHPLSVMESIQRNRFDKLLGIETKNPLRMAENLWATMNANALDFFDKLHKSRFHILKFEALVSEPESEISAVCDFLGVDFNDSVLKPYDNDRMTDGVHQESLSIGDPNFHKHKDIDPSLGEVWKNVKLQRRLGGFARRIVNELGYVMPDLLPDVSIGKPEKMSSNQQSRLNGIKPLTRENHKVNSTDQETSIPDSLKNELFGEND